MYQQLTYIAVVSLNVIAYPLDSVGVYAAKALIFIL